MPKLVVISGADVNEIAIKSEVTIGRGSTNSLPLNEENASRNHAKVVLKDKVAKLIDLGSSNGTRVNGMKATEKELVHGDMITIGKSQLIYQDDSVENREGTVIGGYKLTHKLGEGGMGTVFRATQLSMDRSVALKILKKELCDSREFVKSFLREARLAGQLNHAGIIQVHEVSQQKDVIYFSMEFIEGKTALELVEKEGKLPLSQALDIVIAVTDALAYADTKGIIHRDIKPANIIVTKNNEYKLADLGLAGVSQASKDKKNAGRVMGTPNYIAPEQSENKELDIRADIYALGATFYHLLTGHPPFSGPNTMAIITQHHTEPRPKVRKEVPACPKSVDDLIERMMAIDKKDRPANAKDLLEALKEIKTKEQTAIRKSVAPAPSQESAGAAAKGGEDDKPNSTASRRVVKGPSPSHGKSVTAVHKPAGSGLNSFLAFLVVLSFVAVLGAMVVYFKGPETVFPKDFSADRAAQQEAYERNKRDIEAWNTKQDRAREDFIKAHTPEAAVDVTNPPLTGPIVTPTGPGPKTPGVEEPPRPKTPQEILIATNEVCTAAKLKLDKNDWISAKRMVSEHLQKYGQIPETVQAKEVLKDVNQRIDIFLANCLKNVQDKSKAGEYASAATWGSKAIALEPENKATLEIQVILGTNDIQMQTPSEQAYRDGLEKINEGDFQSAQKIVTNVLARANGTTWTKKLRSLQLQALYGDSISKKLNAALVEANDTGTPFTMVARGTNIGYSVVKLTGFKVACVEGPVMKINNFNDDTMRKWIGSIPQPTAIDHLAAAMFLDLAGLPDVANEEVVKASRDPSTAADAISYSSTHHPAKNLKFYDFMDWKQQLDWEVQSGSWAFASERFECQSDDIGEVNLNAKNQVSANGLTVSWVVFPKLDKSGFMCDIFQDSEHRIAAAVEDDKVRVEIQVGPDIKQTVLPLPVHKDKHLEFSLTVHGNDVTLTASGASKPLTATLAGAGAIKGKLRIQILSGSSAFDNILIQNQ